MNPAETFLCLSCQKCKKFRFQKTWSTQTPSQSSESVSSLGWRGDKTDFSPWIIHGYETSGHPDGPRSDLLEGVAQQEADLAAGVALFAFALIAFGPVELGLDLPDAGDLLLLLAVEIRAGELVSHGFGPERAQNSRGWVTHPAHTHSHTRPHVLLHNIMTQQLKRHFGR